MDDESLRGTTKALLKDIKRAKLFAIQHLTRRIKMLKNKRGTEQQLEKNTRKAARFEEELEFIKELEINVILKRIENNDLDDSVMIAGEDVGIRSMARLISSKPIQDNLKRPPTSKKVSQKTRLKPKQTNLAPSSPPPSRTPSSSDEDSIKSDDEIQLERTPTSFFIESLSSVKTCDATRENRKSRKLKDENASGRSKKDKNPKKERKKSSNRMGQRARQRLWKEQYGKKANFVKSSDKMRRSKHDGMKAHKKGKSNENHKPRQESRTKKGINKRENSEETTNHPSWEASKRRKLQQNISQTTFQGQKITFQDSD